MWPTAQRWRLSASRVETRPPAHRRLPVELERRRLDLAEHDVDHPVDELHLVGHVVVERHRARRRARRRACASTATRSRDDRRASRPSPARAPCSAASRLGDGSARPWRLFGLPHLRILHCTTRSLLQRTNRYGGDLNAVRNLAARAGRWSAQHRKAAIIGWILFVVLAVVVGGKIGQNDLDESATGSGESKRGDMIVEAAGFPEQAGEQVLVQGKGRQPAILQVTAAVGDVVSRLERIDGVTRDREPARPPLAGSSKDGRSVLVSFTLPGTEEHVEKLVEQPLAAVAAAQAAHPERAGRAVRRGLRDQGDRRAGREGRQAVAADLQRPDADHPAGRVRRGRGRRPPARARRHRRRGHRRTARAGQPALRAAGRRGRAHGDHRPRRRRGLRDVLLTPRDGGARPRPLGRGRGGGRRRHLGPRGAHLGPDRDDRDGRAAVRRQPDLRRLRHRHDARRRRRDARLADLPARDARVPQPQELAGEGPRAVSSPSAATRPRASRASGAPSSPASSSARSCRR